MKEHEGKIFTADYVKKLKQQKKKLEDVLRFAVDHGGLTAKSHRHLKKTFDPTNNRVAVGPQMIRNYVNADETDTFEMGGLDVTPDFRLIAKDGSVHNHICALGIPLEGKLWFNAADARPDVNSNAIAQIGKWAHGTV